MPTGTRLVDAADRSHLDATREVAAQVLNAFAVGSLVVATTALAVMVRDWAASSDLPQARQWPKGIGGWLVCLPGLSASVTFWVAAQRISRKERRTAS